MTPAAAVVQPCAAPGCSHPAEPSAPAPLCLGHLAAVAEWSGEATGVEEPLPLPCVACGARLGVTYRSGRLCAVCEWRYGDVPDAELTPPRVDVVYYLRFSGRGASGGPTGGADAPSGSDSIARIKIGTTGNPRQRFGALRFDELLAFERGDRTVEQARHRQFAQHRLGGEWFAAAPALEDHVQAVAAGHPDPWALYARWRSEALALRVS